MAKSGRAAQALATAAIGSFVAGTIGTALIVLVMPHGRRRSRSRLGAPDYLAIMVLAFVAVTAVLGSSRVRGFASLLVGLTHRPRRHRLRHRPAAADLRQSVQLADGIDVVVVAVGLFAVGEALWVAAHLRRKAADGDPRRPPVAGARGLGPVVEAVAARHRASASRSVRSRPVAPRSRPSSPTSPRSKLSKHPEEFGKGAIEGVAGPEAANNASAAGTLVPLLTLGLPDQRDRGRSSSPPSRATASSPGPLLLDEGARAWSGTLIASLFIGNVVLLVLNLPLAPTLGEAAAHPAPLPLRGHPRSSPSIGAYAVERPAVRPRTCCWCSGCSASRCGATGCRCCPLIVGAILGPLFERQLRRSLQTSGGDLSGLIGGPVAWVCYALILGVLFWPLIARLLRQAAAGDDDRR